MVLRVCYLDGIQQGIHLTEEQRSNSQSGDIKDNIKYTELIKTQTTGEMSLFTDSHLCTSVLWELVLVGLRYKDRQLQQKR